ncbi:hypothetical protein P154DRAFT_569444 [Amniculicola lignicola CBS 123094]|uniref:Uncharacterized protein n=1 Tax=Amniculicola lignicola CBS 123094 TaxID=1392246 RepID=A0A6A5X3R0_9PLEO|nr:hypothetical protein P154DRAFT_569444 [Amniculicola lignicola CBS 123094]
MFPFTIALALFIWHTRAFSKFNLICTQPPNGTNFVLAPNTRSSVHILLSTVTVILPFTWSILHLNFPTIHRMTLVLGKACQNTIDSRIKIKRVLFTITVLEYLIGTAFSDSESPKSFKGNSDNQTRTYLENMGYFVLEWDDPNIWA